jgi:hypothetical protein
MASQSSFAIAANVFVAPNEAFAAIRERPNVLLPLILILGTYGIVSFSFTYSVDVPWFMEQQINMSAGDLTPSEREAAIEASSNMAPGVLGAISTVSSSIFILLWTFLVALYYTGVSFATGDGIKLKQWYGLVVWCALPILLGLVASIVNIFISDARFMLQEDINPLSFNNLLSIDTEGFSTLQRILASLDLSTVWSLALTIIGYQTWTQRSIYKAAGIVLGPFVVIFGIAMLLTG